MQFQASSSICRSSNGATISRKETTALTPSIMLLFGNRHQAPSRSSESARRPFQGMGFPTTRWNKLWGAPLPLTEWVGPSGLPDEAADDRVVASHEHDWYRRGCSLGRERRRGISDDQGHLLMNQISDYIRQPMGLIFRRAVFDRDMLALDDARFLQALAERGRQVSESGERCVPNKADHRPLLRPRRKRPRRSRAAERG